MKKSFRFKMNDRGVSVFEAVVAMSIIVIVSMAAMACVEAFSRNSANVNYKNEAVNAAGNLFEIFKATEDRTSYLVLSEKFVTGFDMTTERPTTDEGANDDTHHTYVDTYDISGNVITVTVVYNKTEGTSRFELSLVDSKGRSIVNIGDYTKLLANISAEFPDEGGGGE